MLIITPVIYNLIFKFARTTCILMDNPSHNFLTGFVNEHSYCIFRKLVLYLIVEARQRASIDFNDNQQLLTECFICYTIFFKSKELSVFWFFAVYWMRVAACCIVCWEGGNIETCNRLRLPVNGLKSMNERMREWSLSFTRGKGLF